MKIPISTITCICMIFLLSCSSEKTVELPLTQHEGYGCFNSSLSGIPTYPEHENNPWAKTQLKVAGAPVHWIETKYGDIETNIYQSVYQNYLQGNISREWYENIQQTWNWIPDTTALSKEPLKTKIAFAYGTDSTGNVKMVLDANNNQDFSDDEVFVPYNVSPGENIFKDSIALNHSIKVMYERLTGNKKELVTTPLFLVYMSQFDMYMCNFPQYRIADFNGVKIAVCSNGFTDLSFTKPGIALLNDSLREGDKITAELLISENEFIEIKGKLYKVNGVNSNNNSLVLTKMDLLKNELQSTQIGFKSIPFEGNNFVTDAPISSNALRGKYVLLDFWAVWCGPCRQEIPYLRELYEKTAREKFEIIGVVGDSPLNTLSELIEQDSITWPQIISDEFNKIKEAYGIHGYPTTFLLDPEGIIVAKNLRGKELEEKILELATK